MAADSEKPSDASRKWRSPNVMAFVASFKFCVKSSQDAQHLANGFISLKGARETADYDPNRVMTAGDANFWIEEARAALIAMQAMTAAERQTFSAITLTGNP